MAMDKLRWQWVLAGLLALVLAACGSGGGGTTSANTDTLSGVAATGAGVQGIVSLRDLATGRIQATHTDNGRYAFNVTGLSGPFALRVESDDHAVLLYSVVLKAGRQTQGNINPLTQRVVARLVTTVPGLTVTDPAVAFNSPELLANLDAATLAQAVDWTLAFTSPYFRARLAAHGVSPTVDPVTTDFTVGQGLDLAFDEVQFFYDAVTGTAWEKAVASGQVVGTALFTLGDFNPVFLTVAAPASYLVPGASQTMTATLLNDHFWEVPVEKGLRWEVSDPALASVDADGVVTAAAFTGNHSLTVTAHYQAGDQHLQNSMELTLTEQPLVASVDMSELPDTFQSLGNYPLFTTLHLADGGGMLQSYSGTWTVVDPDPYTQAAVHVISVNGQPVLAVDKPVQDLNVHLRAVQTINGIEHTTDKTVTVKQFVLTPVHLYVQCPYAIDFDVAAACTGSVLNNDGSFTDVTPELQLEVAAEDASAVTASDHTLTSTWDNRSYSRWVVVTGRYGPLSNTVSVNLNPRKTLMTSLEIVGLSALDEGASTTLQAWANWDDGTRTNVSSSVLWTSADTGALVFPAYGYGALTARYILDQASDKTTTVTAETCKTKNYWSCAAGDKMTVSADITVRYAAPALTGVNVDLGDLASGFVTVGGSHALQAQAVWNKKLPDGNPWTTPIASGVTWSSSNAEAVVSGNSLDVAAAPTEPLALISASYQDPNDSGVTRTGRKVVTLYAPLGVPKYLGPNLGSTSGSTALLGGDGLARDLGYIYSPAQGAYYYGPSAPRPFIAQVRQVVQSSYSGPVYLRTDGTVWYPELVSGTSLSADTRQQLMVQLGGYYASATVPRRIPGLDNVAALLATSWWSTPGLLHALKADGTVWSVAPSLNNQTGITSYVLAQQFSGAIKLAGNSYSMFALDAAGHVWSRGGYISNLGRNGEANVFGKVVKADLTELTGIVDIAAYDGAAVALDGQGNLWSWGSNSNGQLGVGDTLNRQFATPVTSVTGFTQLSPTAQAGLRGDGSLWAWGPTYMYNLQPQRVGTFTGLLQAMANYLVDSDHHVSQWSSSQWATPTLSVIPLRDETGGAGTQLLLQ